LGVPGRLEEQPIQKGRGKRKKEKIGSPGTLRRPTGKRKKND